MGIKLCVVAGCMNTTAGSRCTVHEAEYQRARNARRYLTRDRTRAAYRATVIPAGAVCVCCGTDQDLTRHHVVPLADTHGFDNETRARNLHLVPMCRRCNSSIGARVMADHRCPMHGGVVAS